MQITQITVSYGETQSLPEYSNVKPNLTLTAVLEEGDDAQAVENDLWLQAKLAVREQIDQALEANGRPAKWSTEPRYQVMQTYWSEYEHKGEAKPPQYVVILPNAVNLDRGAYAQKFVHAGPYSSEARKLRYAAARQLAEEAIREHPDITLIDCSNGDLTPLNLAIGAPESNPDYAPTPDSPF